MPDAILIMVTDVLLSFIVVAIYSFLIEPGHPREFYDAAAQRIAPWSSHIAGPLIFFAAAYISTKRRPQRNAFLFTSAFCAAYTLITLISLVAMGQLDAFFVEGGIISLALKIIGAFAATFLLTRKKASVSQAPR